MYILYFVILQLYFQGKAFNFIKKKLLIFILITLIIPPKERERQCFLLKGVRDSDVGVTRGCFSNCTQTDKEWEPGAAPRAAGLSDCLASLLLPVWSASFSWPTLACWWPAGTVPWGRTLCNSECLRRRGRSPLWPFVWRGKGRQAGLPTRVQPSSPSRGSDRPLEGSNNKSVLFSYFSTSTWINKGTLTFDWRVLDPVKYRWV